jgi:hypothetical protein
LATVVGPDFFEENVAPELRLIRRGRKRLVPVVELERWVSASAGRPVRRKFEPSAMSSDAELFWYCHGL